MGRDIRNQSPQCSVLPAAEESSSFSSSHAYTLKLFRDSLRCAAGIGSNTLSVAVSPLSTATTIGIATTTPAAATLKTVKPIELLPEDSANTEPTESESVLVTAVQQSSTPEDCPTPSAVITSEGTQAPTEDNASAATCKESTSTLTATTAPATTTASSPGSVVVSFDMGALSGAVKGCGYVTGSSCSTTGLTVDEILDMAMIAGADPNVRIPSISHIFLNTIDSNRHMEMLLLGGFSGYF